MDNASDYGSEDCRFESCQDRKYLDQTDKMNIDDFGFITLVMTEVKNNRRGSQLTQGSQNTQ